MNTTQKALTLALEWLERNTYGNEAAELFEALTAALAEQPAQQEPLTDVIKAAQGVLEWTEIAHRPPKRDQLEAGRMAMVRLHALADLHDALTAHGIKAYHGGEQWNPPLGKQPAQQEQP